jgi:hypothetical protein
VQLGYQTKARIGSVIPLGLSKSSLLKFVFPDIARGAHERGPYDPTATTPTSAALELTFFAVKAAIAERMVIRSVRMISSECNITNQETNMRRVILLSAAVLALGTATELAAQDQTSNEIHGTIKSIDSSNRTVTLENGQTVRLGPGADMSGLQEGGKIDQTCTGGMKANCMLMQPDKQSPAAQESSPENQTAPSAGTTGSSGATTTVPSTTNNAPGTGVSGSSGTNANGTGAAAGTNSGSGSTTMQPSPQNPATQQTSPENQTAPSAGSGTSPSTTGGTSGTAAGGTSGTGSNGSGSGTSGSNGATGNGGSTGSGSGSGSSN